MSTTTMQENSARTTRWALVITLCTVLGAAVNARADSEKPSGILIFPRVELSTQRGIDTVIEMANTRSDGPVAVQCFYIDGLGRCGFNDDIKCRTDADCGIFGACTPSCGERDFQFILTANQPVAWRVGSGLIEWPLPENSGVIIPTEDPFLGELRCVQLDPQSFAPTARNDLIGTATIMDSINVDAGSYTAVGLESIGTNNGDTMLCLGSNNAGDCQVGEYERCPDTLTLNHFFEGAEVNGAAIDNEIALVPCSQSLNGDPPQVTQVEVQVFNEFEERRCAMLEVRCVGDIRLADNPVFSVGLQGSLVGQTRLRPVVTTEVTVGHALVGVAIERHRQSANAYHSAAHHFAQQGAAIQADIMRTPMLP